MAPWAQWLHAAPSLPIGLALACALQNLPASIWKVIAFQASLLISCILLFPIDSGMAISYGVGSLLVTAGFVFNRRLSRRVGQVSAMCLGVYLVYGAVLSGLKVVPFVTQHNLPWFFCAALVSFALVILLRRMPYLENII